MAWISRIRAIFKRKRLAEELEEELEFHLSMRVELNKERGMALAEGNYLQTPAVGRTSSARYPCGLDPRRYSRPKRFLTRPSISSRISPNAVRTQALWRARLPPAGKSWPEITDCA